MSGIATYNQKSLTGPFVGIAGASTIGYADIEHFTVIGATGDAAKPRFVGRQEGAGTATIAAGTADTYGRYGVVTITPDTTSGGRVCQEVASVLLHASDPVFVEWWVKFVTAGSYFVGLAEVVSSASAVISSGALGATVQGVGLAIQTDDKLDIISRGTSGDTANTAVADVITLTAGTWYRLGIKATTGLVEAYVDGRYVGRQVMTTALTTALTPTAVAATNTATKILSCDLVAVGF